MLGIVDLALAPGPVNEEARYSLHLGRPDRNSFWNVRGGFTHGYRKTLSTPRLSAEQYGRWIVDSRHCRVRLGLCSADSAGMQLDSLLFGLRQREGDVSRTGGRIDRR